MSKRLVKIIFEHGLEASDQPHAIETAGGSLHEVCADVQRRYSVRPVMIVDRIDTSPLPRPDLAVQDHEVLLTTNGEVAGLFHSNYLPNEYLHKRAGFFQRFVDWQYSLRGGVYHCMRLAHCYSQIGEAALRTTSIEGWGKTDRANYAFQYDGYYEFDALVSHLRRSFDRLAHLLWTAYGPKGSAPRNCADTLDALAESLPPLGVPQLWEELGKPLKDYRDSVHHYANLECGFGSADVRKVDEGVWSTQLRIPDNPTARSKDKYTYTGGLDALTYGWESLSAILTNADEVWNALIAYKP